MNSVDDTFAATLDSVGKNGLVSPNDLRSVADFLNYYFQNNRPQKFFSVKKNLLLNFASLLDLCSDPFDGINFTSSFFLFNYTQTSDFTDVQIGIHNFIAIPYLIWLKRKFKQINVEPLEFEKGNNIVYVVRHAVTSGLYAPGQTAYIQTKALLESGHNVKVLAIGNIDEKFVSLNKDFDRFELSRIDPNLPIKNRFNALRDYVKKVRPKLIFTEIEFDVLSALDIAGCSSPIFFMSAGYYNLPWYTKLGLFEVLMKNRVTQREKDVFSFPMSVDVDVLAQQKPQSIIEEMKATLGINKEDIIFGCFARKEKFSASYIDFCIHVLDKVPHSKLLIAGPNDDSFIKIKLEKFIKLGRAIILGPSDVHILGRIVNIGLETFPLASGSSILELMAKRIPVVTITKFEDTDIHKNLRVPELVFKNEEKALEKIIQLLQSKTLRMELGRAAFEIINREQKNNQSSFVEIIEKQLSNHQSKEILD